MRASAAMLRALPILLIVTLCAAACVPARVEYPVRAVEGLERPPFWDPGQPTLVAKEGLALNFSPLGLDESGETPVLRLTVILDSRRSRPVLWTVDPERFALAPPGRAPLAPLSIRPDRSPVSRSGIGKLIEVPSYGQARVEIAAPLGGLPLPEVLLLRIETTPWGEPLQVSFSAPPRWVRKWNHRRGS